MPQNKVPKNVNFFKKTSNLDASFLTVFFYLPQNKRESVENLSQFLQKHHMNFGRIQNETY